MGAGAVGLCKKHPGVKRVEMKNSRSGTYFACPQCKAEQKAGGGLPPSPPPKKAKKKVAKTLKKKAAKKAPIKHTPPSPPAKAESRVRSFFRMHGLG